MMKIPTAIAFVLAMTDNGMAATMTQLPAIDPFAGRPCHDQYLADRENEYAKITILKSEIRSLAFSLNERSLRGSLAPEICEKLRRIDEIHDEILSLWNAERKCNPSAQDQSHFQLKIDEGLKFKAKTQNRLRQCAP